MDKECDKIVDESAGSEEYEILTAQDGGGRWYHKYRGIIPVDGQTGGDNT